MPRGRRRRRRSPASRPRPGRSRRDRARNSIAVASGSCDARGWVIGLHSTPPTTSARSASRPGYGPRCSDVGHQRVVHRIVVPDDDAAVAEAPRSSRARRRPARWASTRSARSTSRRRRPAGRRRAPTRYGDGWVPTYSVGQSVSARACRALSKQPRGERRLARRERRAASGCRRAAAGTTRRPRRGAARASASSAARSAARLVVDVEPGRDREAEPHAGRSACAAELAERVELGAVVRRRATRLGGGRRPSARTRTRSCPAPRGTRSLRAARRATTAFRRSPRRCRARRTIAARARRYRRQRTLRSMNAPLDALAVHAQNAPARSRSSSTSSAARRRRPRPSPS